MPLAFLHEWPDAPQRREREPIRPPGRHAIEGRAGTKRGCVAAPTAIMPSSTRPCGRAAVIAHGDRQPLSLTPIASKPEIMGFLSALFVSRKQAIKREVAARFGGRLVPTAPGHTIVVSEVDGWSVLFDIDAPQAGPPPIFFGPRSITRIAIPYVSQDKFVLTLGRRGIVGQKIYERRIGWSSERGQTWESAFQEIQPGLTPPGVVHGFGDFDYEFFIDTNDEDEARRVLEDPGYRALVQAQRTVYIRVAPDDEWLSWLVPELAYDVSTLVFEYGKVLADIGRIQGMQGVLSATMERLVEVGAASSKRPRVF